MTWNTTMAAGGVTDQPCYCQFGLEGCFVGCGPVAWAMLICWADYQAAHGNSYWVNRWGLYRQDGGRYADAVAPLQQDTGVENVIRELHGQVGTYCSFGLGATNPWDMPNAWCYLDGRSAASVQVDWNSVGWCEDWIRDRAIDSIVNRHTPAIIGTGWLTHYPLAFGYAWQTRVIRHTVLWWSWDEVVTDRQFLVNQGNGDGGVGDWIDASTWFSGQLFPY